MHSYNYYNDPFIEEKDRDTSFKFLFFLFQILLLCSGITRLYVLFFWFLGFCEVILRAYLTSKKATEGGRKLVFIHEIGCAWESGDFTLNVIIFWPVDFLIVLIQSLLHAEISFSASYKSAKFSAYNSGRGRYYGMHTETACEWSEADVKAAQEGAIKVYKKVEFAGQAVKKQSKFALIYTSIIGFLTVPLAQLRSYRQSSKDAILVSALGNSVEKEFFDFKALIDNSFESLIRLLKSFFVFLRAVISFYSRQETPLRKILWRLSRPIRAIPIEWFGKTNQINAPPVGVLVNSLSTRTLKKGGSYESQNINWVGNFFGYCFSSAGSK